MPVIIAFPAIVAALILLTYSLRIFEAYRPRWTMPFVQEAKEKAGELDPEPIHQSLTSTLSLLAITAIGIALQVLTIFFPERNTVEIYPSIAWVSILHVHVYTKKAYEINRASQLSSSQSSARGLLQHLYCYSSLYFCLHSYSYCLTAHFSPIL
jgi:hypothetical protein